MILLRFFFCFSCLCRGHISEHSYYSSPGLFAGIEKGSETFEGKFYITFRVYIKHVLFPLGNVSKLRNSGNSVTKYLPTSKVIQFFGKQS